MSYVTMRDLRPSGLGQAPTKVEASSDVKKTLTALGKQVIDLSKSVPVASLLSIEAMARDGTARLDSFMPFEESGTFSWGSWDSSQTIRSNFQGAVFNIRVRTGEREGRLIDQGRDVSVLRETVKELPGAVVDRAGEIASGKVFSSEQCRVLMMDSASCRKAQECEKSTSLVWCALGAVPTWAKVGAGVAVAGVGLFYLGPFIKAAGNLVERSTRK